MLIYALTDNRS